jgi:hypothetical protein
MTLKHVADLGILQSSVVFIQKLDALCATNYIRNHLIWDLFDSFWDGQKDIIARELSLILDLYGRPVGISSVV